MTKDPAVPATPKQKQPSSDKANDANPTPTNMPEKILEVTKPNSSSAKRRKLVQWHHGSARLGCPPKATAPWRASDEGNSDILHHSSEKTDADISKIEILDLVDESDGAYSSHAIAVELPEPEQEKRSPHLGQDWCESDDQSYGTNIELEGHDDSSGTDISCAGSGTNGTAVAFAAANDDDNDSDRGNHATRWRKSSLLVKRHSQTLKLKQQPKGVTHSGKQRKASPFSAAQYGMYDTIDDSSEESGDRDRHLGSNNQPTSTMRPYGLHRYKRKRNQHRKEEEDEYEVEEILQARFYYRKLQFRAKWVGYEDDPQWYDASNFKNSPYKLKDFYMANPTCPGPPKRLDWWIRCWQEDRDADDHCDDNKPKRSHDRSNIMRLETPSQ